MKSLWLPTGIQKYLLYHDYALKTWHIAIKFSNLLSKLTQSPSDKLSLYTRLGVAKKMPTNIALNQFAILPTANMWQLLDVFAPNIGN